MEKSEMAAFQRVVWQWYQGHGRHDLPWRSPEADGSFDPYKILVSEFMLQQTQVKRVVPKFASFMQLFPDVTSLAASPLADVLKAWNGLGYNRRAKFLWQAAKKITDEWRGVFPQDVAKLTKLPGVGTNTAGAVMAYAFDSPAIFIETNIRTVFIHHFFVGQQGVADDQILTYVKRSLSTQPSARGWYWALMDYGSYLKLAVGNVSRASSSYTRQSRFEGSIRQIRGQVLRQLSRRPIHKQTLSKHIPDSRLDEVIKHLIREGLIQEYNDCLRLAA